MDDLVGLLCDDLLRQRGNVREMVVKRVAVDAAVNDNVFHGDLIQRPLIEQLDKRCPDRHFRKVRHSYLLAHIECLIYTTFLENLQAANARFSPLRTAKNVIKWGKTKGGIRMRLIVLALCSYLIGGINPAYLLTRRKKGVDIRSCGTGNAGATNAMFALGFKPALVVMLLDVCKAVLCVLAGRYLVPGNVYAAPLAGLVAFSRR